MQWQRFGEEQEKAAKLHIEREESLEKQYQLYLGEQRYNINALCELKKSLDCDDKSAKDREKQTIGNRELRCEQEVNKYRAGRPPAGAA